MGVPKYLAGFDSASSMVMATGKVLNDKPFTALGNPPPLKPVARATRFLPKKVRGKIFVASGAMETYPEKKLPEADLEEASEWIASEYPDRTYPQVVVGSSSGALVYLNAALGQPWLPQTLLIPLKHPVHPDDPVSALEEGKDAGIKFVQSNPDIQLHHMHDAVQDRQMVRVLTYFRYKRRKLGSGFERFLNERLEPGGTIILSECKLSWNTTRVTDRYVFQHGALGGATEEEFHEGGERVHDYLEKHDSPVREWPEPEPDTESPEAEWGFAEALRDDVLDYAGKHGMKVKRLIFDHPEDLSPMVADLYRWWYARRNIPTKRLLIGSFAISAPWWALRTGSVPYWMYFNEENSLRRVSDYLDSREPFEDIVMTLFQNGVETIGTPSSEQWQGILDRAKGEGKYAGASLDDYPFDFAIFGSYDDALKEIPARFPMPAPLTLEEFEEFLSQAGDYDGVSWEEAEVSS